MKVWKLIGKTLRKQGTTESIKSKLQIIHNPNSITQNDLNFIAQRTKKALLQNQFPDNNSMAFFLKLWDEIIENPCCDSVKEFNP